MKDSLLLRQLVAAGMIAGLTAALPASATVVGFEDFVNPGCCTFIPPGYQGFTWSGGAGGQSWVVAEESANVFSGTEAHSGDNYAWSNGATDLSLDGAVFDLNGFWARIGNLTAGGAIARGFLGGIEIYTQNLSLTDVYALQSLDFFGIDKFTLTDQANNILIDDISINAANVPEPGTLALSALALVGLCLSLRHRT